ncbi:MAG: copper amine oxidase N-terminal domain-containing protein [Filifactoraceae bacterium]
MKKIISIAMLGIMLLSPSTILAQNKDNVTVYVDGVKLTTKSGDPYPMIVNNRTLMPFTAFLEAIGCQISWDEATKTATATKDGTSIVVSINNNVAFVNGEAKNLDVPPQIIKNRTMIPISFVANELGYSVTWDANKYIANIGKVTSPTPTPTPVPTPAPTPVAPIKDSGEKNTKITGTFAMQNLQRQNFVVQFNSSMKVDIKNITTGKIGIGTFSVNGNAISVSTDILTGNYTLEDVKNDGKDYIMLKSHDEKDILALQEVSYESFVSGYVSNS